MIEKQKGDLNVFMAKYNDLEKAIADYKEEQVQLELYRKKTEDFNKHLVRMQSQLNSINQQLKDDNKKRKQ